MVRWPASSALEPQLFTWYTNTRKIMCLGQKKSGLKSKLVLVLCDHNRWTSVYRKDCVRFENKTIIMCVCLFIVTSFCPSLIEVLYSLQRDLLCKMCFLYFMLLISFGRSLWVVHMLMFCVHFEADSLYLLNNLK